MLAISDTYNFIKKIKIEIIIVFFFFSLMHHSDSSFTYFLIKLLSIWAQK